VRSLRTIWTKKILTFIRHLASLKDAFGKKSVPAASQDLKSVIDLLDPPKDIIANLSEGYSEYRNRLVKTVA